MKRTYVTIDGQRVPVVWGDISGVMMPYVTIHATGPQATTHVDGRVPIATTIVWTIRGTRRTLRRRKK